MTLTKLWTTIGLQKQINCLLNGDNFAIKYIAVGDGAGAVPTPSADDTSLVNEVWRGEISEITDNSPQFTAIAYIPEDEGDFIMRELGIFDEDDNLLFVAQMDETPKYSTDTTGLIKEIGLKVVFELQNGLSPVIVDPSATTATCDYVDSAVQDALGDFADTSLSNLTQGGEDKLNYNVFCVNTGVVNDDGTPAFMENVESKTITSSYSSSGISNFSLDTSIYFDGADYGEYTFTYDSSDWLLDDEAVDLADYGITYDEKFTVSEYYTSDTITSCSINSTTFLSTVDNAAGTYTFTYSVTNSTETDETEEETEETVTTTVWTLDDEAITLDDYGITTEGEALDGDTITVTVASLLNEDDTITVTVTQTYTLTTSGEFDVTTANGKTYTISDTLTLDITDLEEGTYNVYVNPVDMTLSVLSNTLTAGIVFPDDAESGDYLLNTAKVPYDLQKINITEKETTDEDSEETAASTITTTITTGLNEVYTGTLTLEDENVTLELNGYNKNIIEAKKDERLTELDERITELDERPYVVETYTDGTKWYRIYSDGWCEQGNTATVCNNTITFLVAYKDTNYTLVGPGFVIADIGGQYVSKTTTGFTATSSNKNCTVTSWYACGYTI